MDIPKVLIYAVLTMTAIAIAILLVMYFMSRGESGGLIANATDWSNAWKF